MAGVVAPAAGRALGLAEKGAGGGDAGALAATPGPGRGPAVGGGAAAAATPATTSTGKYVPPNRRARQPTGAAAGGGGAAAGGTGWGSSGSAGRDSSNMYRGDTMDRMASRGGRFAGLDSGGVGSGSFGGKAGAGGGGGATGAGSGGGAVAERWKVLAEEEGSSPAPRYGGSGSFGGGASRTGTGWDIRGRRRWVEEDEEAIFTQDKDKCVGINFDKYDAVPVDLTGTGNEAISPLKSFNDAAGVHPLLAANIKRVGYERPTPIQRYSIPVLLARRDLMACAQTGSGKTAAFLFPIITSMLKEGPPKGEHGGGRTALPVALVLAPTRELAVQTFEEGRKFCFHTGIRTVVLYGGAVSRDQTYELRKGCDICVATPGRLCDLLEHDALSLQAVTRFVLDEADRMLDMGFMPQIYNIVDNFQLRTSAAGRQTIMFSATFPQQIQKLAAAFLHDYLFLTVGRVGATSDCITQHLVYADEKAKPGKLLKILDEYAGKLVLVFVETKRKADIIEHFLRGARYPAVAIHGDKTQSDRMQALAMFRCGERPVLVATDVAARGLDVHNIEHVINCDLPSKIDDYVHRIGRTGRAGNKGVATSFVNEKNRGVLRDLLATLESSQQEIPQWFLSMVAECTSASRGFGSGNFTFARGASSNVLPPPRSGGPAPARGGFGGKDIRAGSGGGATTTSAGSTPVYPGGGDESEFLRAGNARARNFVNVAYDGDDDDGW